LKGLKTALPDYETHRGQVDLEWPLDKIWTLPWKRVCKFELLPGSSLTEDTWILPPEWASAGARQSLGARKLDFTRALPDEWARKETRSELYIRRLKRLAVLLFTQTLRLQDHVRKPPQPSTWIAMMKRLFRAARDAVLSAKGSSTAPTTCPDEGSIFAHLSVEQVRLLEKKHSAFLEAETPRLNALFRHKHFDDWPAGDVSPAIRKKNKRKWLPFSDEFTGLVGHAAMWITEELGPEILEFWSGIRTIRESSIATTHPRKASELRSDFVSHFKHQTGEKQWRYSLKVITHDGEVPQSAIMRGWNDLQSSASANSLAIILQDAHAAIVNLACGPRNGELVSLPRDCLREVMHGTLLRGYTFKLAEDKEARDWPLPAAAIAAIRQQQRLADELDPGGTKLFISFSKGKKRVSERDKLTIAAHRFTNAVLTDEGKSLTSYCNGNVHSHRYRKTVARLAALSLVGANQILFDILGHRDPEMTLNYILSDPELQTEMRTIAREAALVMAKEAINGADSNGGAAANGVRELSYRFRARSAEAEMDESSLLTVAKILSQDGRVMLAKKNVLCTKALNQAGPCNRSIGNPDIANCQVGCLHRLELAAAMLDHRRSLLQLLDDYEHAEGMMKIWVQGQALAHLMPFPALLTELAEDRRLASMLKEIKLDTIDALVPDDRPAALAILEVVK
jgi:integrase